MITRTLAQIAEMTGAAAADPRNVVVRGVSTDTRTLAPGNLFVPIIGERFNGHDFVRQAIERGASAVLWRRGEPNPPEDVPVLTVEDTLAAIQRLAAAYRRQLGVRVIGVTGSNGKTSVKDILAALLGVRYKTQRTPGNLNNHLGVPLTLLALKEDTEYAVVEMGMSGLGEIRSLSGLAAPDAAIITSVSEVHLADLHTRERILQAKLEIVEALHANSLFIYNGDHAPLREAVAALHLPCRQIAFGLEPMNALRAENIAVSREGTAFALDGVSYFLPIPGRHQAVNALAAIAAARHAGLSDEEIADGLRRVRLTGLRTEWVETGSLSVINDAYKSNPPSVRAALELLYELGPYPQKVAVLGDMVELGEESAALHREIGSELRPDQLDYVLTIGPEARQIAEAARTRFDPQRVIECADQEELLARLRQVVQPHALVLVKGSRCLGLERMVERLKQEAVG
jgi:UDP-N-acetylmuramoyl-tripeptide--D-alanyl-D-alanine ligase